ncbi:MAG: restriction endonuclease subunit S [Anaerolineales bacterium]|nr:restriction endonuclease subunit S [Anaerolineales bacterium]
MSKWIEYAVADLVNHDLLSIGDGYRAKNSELNATSTNGIPFARVKNVKGGFDFGDVDYFPTDRLSKVGHKISKVGDTVFTSKGTVGRFAYVSETVPRFVYSPQLCFWRSIDHKFILPRFLFYWMQGREFLAQVDAVKSQTDMADYVNLTDQRQMILTIPKLVEQEAIAGILSSLDDKIDLLHRQNQTLENIAQALFRHWFIDNAEDSWEEYRIGDLVSHLRRSVKPSDHPGEIFTHFSIPAYDNGKMPIRELGSEIRSNKYQITPFSILVSKLNPRFPRIWDIYFEPESNSICSTEFQVFRPTPLGNFGFLYHLFKSKEVVAEMQISASGTSGSHQRVSPEDILSISFLAPDQEAITRFSRMIDPLTLKRVKNLTQAQTLGKLRDTLLPKLMSGEVRVRFPRSDHI